MSGPLVVILMGGFVAALAISVVIHPRLSRDPLPDRPIARPATGLIAQDRVAAVQGIEPGSPKAAAIVTRKVDGGADEDQYTYVRRLIDAARAGDPKSKYEVWKSLIFCKRDARSFKGRTVSEAIRESPTPYPHEIQRIEDTFRRCGQFYSQGFQDFDDTVHFRSDAADAGYAPAVVDVALGQLAGGSEDLDGIEARVLRALNSRSPEALVLARQLRGLNITDETTSVALVLAGCQLGYDCTRSGPLMREICSVAPSCEDDSYASLMEKHLGPERFRVVSDEAGKIQREISKGSIDPNRFHWGELDNTRFRMSPEQLLRSTTVKKKQEG